MCGLLCMQQQWGSRGGGGGPRAAVLPAGLPTACPPTSLLAATCLLVPPSQVQKRIRTLEDRVQQASVRHNEMLGRNRALRARIDSLRRVRGWDAGGSSRRPS